ncbi:MAG: NUDIX domain-containing protein [Actinobacteria bacterium]|uniref:Unannotated protein n=1 Tax=freshwater metagenome TaxID=449393 RepID=A0A6J7K2C6_9ZZZZ|nr:NUDIX domain-containing protein [Actinomycetota bacterium]MTA78466.1 NUDIX domain-containing protein [Actinomycetota bacterium]
MSDPSSGNFDPLNPPKRAVTVDVIVFTVADGALWAVLTRRGSDPDDPFPGRLCLPGSFVGDDEELLQTAQRVLHDKVGLSIDAERLSRSGVYDLPERDPRMRTISVAFTVLIAEHDHHEFIGLAKRRGDLHLVAQLLEDDAEMLAFDHQRILIEAREHAGVLLEETNAALDLLPPVFTLAQLRGVYDAVWGTELDPGNFIKRVTRIEGFLEQLPLESDRPGEFASAPTAPDAEWVEYRTDSYLKSFAPTELPEEQSFERLSVLRPTASRGRPPRYFTAGGSRSLHPSLRRPGSYFSKPTRPSAPTD